MPSSSTKITAACNFGHGTKWISEEISTSFSHFTYCKFANTAQWHYTTEYCKPPFLVAYLSQVPAGPVQREIPVNTN
ncbi:hypothetical protein CSPX01_01670 [Colletotrichum filicis]|nr:hypothetical protein CSPX01_01670 [Colletotrichum filicis]